MAKDAREQFNESEMGKRVQQQHSTWKEKTFDRFQASATGQRWADFKARTGFGYLRNPKTAEELENRWALRKLFMMTKLQQYTGFKVPDQIASYEKLKQRLSGFKDYSTASF